MIVLIGSEFATQNAPSGTVWNTKGWRTRDGKTTLYYAVVDYACPEGFECDDRYSWKLDGDEVEAWFSPDVLKAWHSEGRGIGELSRRPHIIYSQKRELTIQEKLAAQAPKQSIIPQPVKRAPSHRSGSLTQAHREEVDAIVGDYNSKMLVLKGQYVKDVNQLKAETMRVIREVSRSYGQPNFTTRLPE